MTAFPLLAKELTEIAARRRTYITRVAYAVLLFLFFTLQNASTLKNAARDPLNSMGAGQQMFNTLIFLQLIGIYLFLPALTAGLITQEKERDSLVLLFLTELKPWQILLQKYASGLVAIFSFLLIGMPLAAFCYAYGGISKETLFTGVHVLLLTCLQVGAFALMCSAISRTTVGAFIGTYLGQTGLFFGLRLIGELLKYGYGRQSELPKMILSAFPFSLLANLPLYWTANPGIADVLMNSLPAIGTTILFLLIARFYLVRRAGAAGGNQLLGFFRWLDARMQRANHLVGNVTFHTRDRALPEDEPVAWRELTRRGLGRPHYLARVLIALEIPTVALCYEALVAGQNAGAISTLAAVLGTLAVLILSITAANAFVSERVNQTYEVLLTTPLTATEIVRQKARMLSRFMWVLAVPLMTVFVSHWWLDWGLTEWNPSRASSREPTLYLFCAALAAGVCLPLAKWLSLWIGLKIRTRFRAILTALGVIAGWCALPLILKNSFLFSGGDNELLLLMSPLGVPIANEESSLRSLFPKFPLGGVIVHFCIYGAILLAIRRRCLRNADAYLRG